MRVRVTITGTYEISHETMKRDYGTDDIIKACVIDKESFTLNPHDALEIISSDSFVVTVSPDDMTLPERQALCPANHGSQCCGFPEVCATVPDLPDSEFE